MFSSVAIHWIWINVQLNVNSSKKKKKFLVYACLKCCMRLPYPKSYLFAQLQFKFNMASLIFIC